MLTKTKLVLVYATLTLAMHSTFSDGLQPIDDFAPSPEGVNVFLANTSAPTDLSGFEASLVSQANGLQSAYIQVFELKG